MRDAHRFARAVLRIAAFGLAAFGAALLVRPGLIAYAGVDVVNQAGSTEIRAFYGGVEIGLAVFLAIASARDAWLRPAALVQALALGGIALARVVGMMVDRSATPALWLFLAVEAAGALLGVIAYLWLDRQVGGSSSREPPPAA